MKRNSSWLAKNIQFFLQFKFTPPGRMAVFLICLSAIGIITTEIPIYQVFCGIVALYGVGEVVGFLMVPRLKVYGSLPSKSSAGETLFGLLSVENKGILPALDIACSGFDLPAGVQQLDPESTIPLIRRRRTATLPVQLKIDRRGEYVLSTLYVHSTFPLNLMRTGALRLPPQRVTVVPAFSPLEELNIPISHRYQHGGVLHDSHSGNAAEYVGNRDYIPGEPTKRLDFRAWARLGKPVVREYQDEFCSRVAVVLDTFTSPTPYFKKQIARDELEGAISLTAAVIESLDRNGITLELFAAGTQMIQFSPADPSQTSLESILEVLAMVERAKTNPFERITTSISESLDAISVVICVFVDWDSWREELVSQITESGASVRVILVRDRPPTSPFPIEENYSVFESQGILQGDVCLL